MLIAISQLCKKDPWFVVIRDVRNEQSVSFYLSWLPYGYNHKHEHSDSIIGFTSNKAIKESQNNMLSRLDILFSNRRLTMLKKLHLTCNIKKYNKICCVKIPTSFIKSVAKPNINSISQSILNWTQWNRTLLQTPL